MSKRVLVPIANGSEEIEAVCIIDVLRRAGAEVVVASVEEGLQITASRGVRIVADQLLEQCEGDFDLIVLPGGMPGAERLRDTPALIERLQQQQQSKRLYGAICAAPAVVLDTHQLLNQSATAHPAFSDNLADQSQVHKRVVVDGNCITSRGPGTSLEFSLTLVSLLYDEETARQVADPMMIP